MESPKRSCGRSSARSKDQKLRDFFVRQYAPLVKYVAGKIALGMPQNVEFDDLVGFGVFGLFDAIDKFDPGKHVKFKTYAVTRIRGRDLRRAAHHRLGAALRAPEGARGGGHGAAAGVAPSGRSPPTRRSPPAWRWT